MASLDQHRIKRWWGMSDFEVIGTGFQQEVSGRVYRIPEFDPRTGDHFWILPVTYRITDPKRWYDSAQPNESRQLDLENLVLVTEIGCWYCEEPWSKRLGDRRCKGHPAVRP